jgi:hypothetical protein
MFLALASLKYFVNKKQKFSKGTRGAGYVIRTEDWK